MALRAFAVVTFFAPLLVACTDGDKPVPDASMQLTFDGEACTYEGPTVLAAGPARLVFFNSSDGRAAVNL